MRATSPSAWVPPVVAGGWCLGFLRPTDGPGLVALLLVVVGMTQVARRPVAAATLVAAAGAVTALAGVPFGRVDLVAASAYALFAVGRRCGSLLPGLLVVALIAGTTAARDGLAAPKVAVTLSVFGTMWVFGRVVRRRALEATAAVQESLQLAATDPGTVVADRMLHERRTLADGALRTLRTAVRRMLASARGLTAGDRPIDVAEIEAIRAHGTTAVAELRALLVALESARREPDPPGGPPVPPATPAGRLRADLLVALAAAVAMSALQLVNPTWPQPSTMTLHVGVVAALALRRSWPVGACGCIVLATLPVVWQPGAEPYRLLPAAGVYALLTWAIVNRTGWRPRFALACVLASGVAVGVRFGVDGIAFIAVVFLLGAAAGRAWGERDRIWRSAEDETRRLRSHLELETTRALRRERLQIARELHDVTSHALGVMMLQAGAAEALLPDSPDRARAALHALEVAGSRALVETTAIVSTLDDSDYVATVLASPDRAPLRLALEDLVAQSRTAGMTVQARLGLLPDSPGLATATYRVVQEALTNAARHAPGATTSIRVDRHGERFLVEVRDTGAPGPVTSEHVSGFGLTGLAERVRSLGGEFESGPLPGSGFGVRAVLPAPTGEPMRAEDRDRRRPGAGPRGAAGDPERAT